jgi:transcriptional/translational regulatory protein YebC/TACO1
MKRHGGSLGNAGCVSFTFSTIGEIVVERTPTLSEDDVMEYALDSGADDVVSEDDAFVVNTSVSAFSSVRKYLEEKGLNFFEAEIKMVPQNKITLDGEDLIKFNRLIDALDDLDDVQNVYHNVDLPEEEEE